MSKKSKKSKKSQLIPTVTIDQSQEDLQVEAITALLKHIPTNSYGLPTGIYRVDTLPFHDYLPSTTINHEPLVSQTLVVDTSGVDSDTLVDDDLDTLDDDDDFDDDEPQFDPETLEPIAHMDRAPRDRSHPLIPPLKVGGEEIPSAEQSTLGEHRVCGFRPEELHGAFVDLHYDEGFPTFLDGDPFWTMLKYEPSEAYQALVQYLYMSGTQTIKPETEELVQDTDAEPSVASGMRSISQLASQLDTNTSTVLVTQAKLKRWAILYYWDWRARAYDMFRLVQHRSQQEIRAIETQDSHYLIAKKLTQRALDFMENDADFLDMLTPKVAIDLIKLGTSLERISAGLPAAGPANEAVLGVVSAQLSLQRVANNSQTSDDVVDITKDSAILDAALNDPKQTEYLQKFILSIQMGGS